MPSSALTRRDPRLRPPRRFKVVLLEEDTGRIVREKTGISEAAAAQICELVDVADGVAGAFVDIARAGRTITGAIDNLLGAQPKTTPRKLPRRRA